MWNLWTKLAEANVNHYIDHPVRHAFLGIAWLVGSLSLAAVAFRKFVINNSANPYNQ